MIKAVFFDLDGTLLDRDRSLQYFIEGQYQRYREALHHIDVSEYTSRFLELDEHGYTPKDLVYQRMEADLHLKHIDWQDLLQDYRDQFQYSCVPFAGMDETLGYLKDRHIKLGLVTNGEGAFQMKSIQALQIAGMLDGIFISEWEGMAKLDSNLFHKALAALGVQPNESAFVGDHPVNDINAAKAAGMIAIWKKTTGITAENADYIIDSLAEITNIVAESGSVGRRNPSSL